MRNDVETTITTDGEEATRESDVFSREVVPQTSFLDELPGLIQEVADDGEEAILTGLTAIRFRDPVLVGEEVVLSAEFVEERENFTVFDIEARATERGSLTMTGSVTATFQ